MQTSMSPAKMNPSPSCAPRRNAGSENPPTQIGIWRVGLGMDVAPVHAVELALEADQRLRPQSAEVGDLLVEPLAAGREVLPEGVVLDVVPPGPDAEPQPLAAQQVEVGGLAGDEHGLALREDQHAGQRARAAR